MENHSHKNILVLYTGGTIGMVIKDGSYDVETGYLSKKLSRENDLYLDHMPKFTIKEYDTLIDSSNINPNSWVGLAGDILANYNDYDGFVILHGTDTLAYAEITPAVNVTTADTLEITWEITFLGA